jgi:MscS family membrane protein
MSSKDTILSENYQISRKVLPEPAGVLSDRASIIAAAFLVLLSVCLCPYLSCGEQNETSHSSEARKPLLEAKPLKPPDTSSPRATLQSFLDNINAAYERTVRGAPNDFVDRAIDRAVRCLDLSKVPPYISNELAIGASVLLKETLDRISLPKFESIPGREEVKNNDIESWTIPDTEITIVLVKSGPRQGEFLFSPDTVDRAEEFFDRVKSLPYRSTRTPNIARLYRMRPGVRALDPIIDRMPSWLMTMARGNPIWKWIAVGASMLLGLFAIGAIIAWRARRRTSEHTLRHRLGGMLGALLAVSIILGIEYCLTWVIMITGSALHSVRLIFDAMYYSVVAWLAVEIVSTVGETVISLVTSKPGSIDAQLVRFGFRVLTAAVAVIVIVHGTTSLGLPTYSIVTGLGIGGAALALAARESLENFFGSIMIMADRPFRVGDWIVIKGNEGTVEDIGFRSTRIRTFYDSVISLPNAMAAKESIDNMGRRQYRRVRTTAQITYDTPPAEIQAFVNGIRQIIADHPHSRKDFFHVALNDFGPHSLDVLINFFLEVPDWGTELIERERILNEILELADTLGVRFAFPTHTLHLESVPDSIRLITDRSIDENE